MKHKDKKENYCIEKVQAVPIQFSKTTGIIPSTEKPFRRYIRSGN
ncbi:hypothetical protein [Flammeovirga pectinis]|nr:hypothetical protein [Flammeovirga pectinis]